ncbi:MAG: DUF192 domain-containing protein [Rhodobacteraceae bacterium]|nr:DUF192 domain-containing protein [Paracoccaceae bacterium]
MVFAGFSSAVVAGECRGDQLDIQFGGDVTRFTVEIADTLDERALGLMNRDYMAPFSGMLFVYEDPQTVSFWMKNTLIPLDMIFIDDSGVVMRIHENAEPLSLSGIPGGSGIQFVLEINGGMARMLGIKVGAQVRHPEIDTDLAIWPCGT